MVINTLESKQWTDDPFREKFVRIPSIYYRDRMLKAGFDSAGKRILDFGCRSGLTTYGLAAHLDPEYVLGVDLELYINEKENLETAERFGFDFTFLKKRVGFRSIRANESLGLSSFDCVVSWSVIEHIDRRIFREQLQKIYQCLKPGGIAIIQSAPLYYSPFGSHVYDLPPWSHLEMSESEFDGNVRMVADAVRSNLLISCKNTLNRFTSADIERHVVAVGFNIEDFYMTKTTLFPSKNLLEKFSKDILVDEQVVFLLRKSN